MTMMMSDLPQDLMEEILSRVPATVLKRLRHTCKRWNALFKNQGFTQKHQRKAPKQSHLLMLKGFRVCPMIVEIDHRSQRPAPSIEFKDALDLKSFHSKQVDIDEVFHCDGLLLCTTKNNNLVVWNPFLGGKKWIKARPVYKKRSMFALGYQNNQSCRSYKILSCWYNRYQHSYKKEYRKQKHTVVEFEMYEFSSGSWRVLDDMDPDYYIHRTCGVSLEGNTYWVATSDGDESLFLLCFDFTRERFRRLCLPPFSSLSLRPDSTSTVLSLVREEQLSVCHNQWSNHESKMEVWVTNNKFDTETALLWSKSITVDLGLWPYLETFLLDEEKKVAVCCATIYHFQSQHLVYVIGEDYCKETPL